MTRSPLAAGDGPVLPAGAVALSRRRILPFRTPVRGHGFAARPPGAPEVVPARAVVLRREPANPADALAVAVWLGDDDGRPWRIGYVERAVAARLAPWLDAGRGLGARLDGWVPTPDGHHTRPVILVAQVPDPPRRETPPREGLAGRPPSAVRRRIGMVR